MALIVEDEKQILRFIRATLQSQGWTVHEAGTVARGLIEAATRRPDLLIVDLGLPDGDGVAMIQDIRGWSDVPIIVVSARADEADKIDALDAGADDYLTKPFGIGELMARVRVALRRSRATPDPSDPCVRFGDVSVDLARSQVTKADKPVHLTPIEYRLLANLITNAGRVVTHRQLLKAVWGPNSVEHGHYLRIYMGHLRHKLEDDSARPQHLLTETGVGYRLQL